MNSIKKNKIIQALEIQSIIFDKSDLVSITCKLRMDQQIQSAKLLFTFTLFNDLLRLGGSCSEGLQIEIANKLLSTNVTPYSINTKDQKIIITTCELHVSKLIHNDNETFIVENILPLNLLQQAKNLVQNLKDFTYVSVQTPISKQQNMFPEMRKMYNYYSGLLELNINEKNARQRAGLQNPYLFRLAYLSSFNLIVPN